MKPLNEMTAEELIVKPLNEMTAEELIVSEPNHEITALLSYITALRNKLKEAITPNPDEIHIVWSVDHVYGIAEKHSISITLEQAREVLRRVKAAHEAPLGVKWDVIDCALYDVYDAYCEGR